MSTKQTEALKLALEALENNVGEYRVDGAKAIIREALTEQATEPVARVLHHFERDCMSTKLEAAMRQALERIADPRNTHFAGDAQVVAREALAAVKQKPTDLRGAVFTVLEGFTLPHDVRKILEAAYYSNPAPAQQPLTDDRYINAMSALTHLLMVHEGRDNSTAKEIARQMSEHGITGSKEGGAA